ncbi:pyridine nucleotide-disulfide oxidoreductase-domain-containing protein [Usnea florida]
MVSLASTRCFSQSLRMRATVGLNALDAEKGDRERIIILGSGWAGYILSQRLSAKYQTLVISPRSYFVFTPLLTSTATGTLEFRTALEPVRSKRKPNVEFVQGWADDVDFGRKMLTVEESVVDPQHGKAVVEDRRQDHSIGEMRSENTGVRKEGKRFNISYDKLVVSVGCYSQTFGTKGVKDHAFFMKDVGDARRIRKRVLECFEIASLPTTSDKLRAQLLRFAIVGGGPTGMEFAAELSDLVHQDLSKLYPALAPKVQIAVYDVAEQVLSMFDKKLGKYAMEVFRRRGVCVKTSHRVQELRPGLPSGTDSSSSDEENSDDAADAKGCYTLTTKEEGPVGVGLCVWSTGNMMNPFVQKALAKTYSLPSPFPSLPPGTPHPPQDSPPPPTTTTEWMMEKHPKTGAIVVDDRLRLQVLPKPSSSSPSPPSPSSVPLPDVFALGDNATVRDAQLPATAQTASQQALWLSKRLNRGDLLAGKGFAFRNLGIMTFLGGGKGVVQVGRGAGSVSGRVAWVVWRGAYLTMSVSWRNKVLVVVYWFLNWAFGRDITRF